MDYTLRPTDPMKGVHLAGTVTRRLLINYPVTPEVLSDYLPPGAVVSQYNGMAWVSVCFVRLRKVRPWPLPGFLGQSFRYFIMRTRASLPYPDGEMRETVLILDSSVDRGLMALAGRLSTGLHFGKRRMKLENVAGGERLRLWDRDGTLLYDATVGSVGHELPARSVFSSVDQADEFIAGVSFGAEWDESKGKLRFLAETHDPWEARVASAETRKNWFLEDLGVDTEADHLISLDSTPHYFQFGRHTLNLSGAEPISHGTTKKRRRWTQRSTPL